MQLIRWFDGVGIILARTVIISLFWERCHSCDMTWWGCGCYYDNKIDIRLSLYLSLLMLLSSSKLIWLLIYQVPHVIRYISTILCHGIKHTHEYSISILCINTNGYLLLAAYTVFTNMQKTSIVVVYFSPSRISKN